MGMDYVSLHHHSCFSYMDGVGRPDAHVERAAELGMSAMALTEHGNTSSHVQLEKAAQKSGINPIFGLEAYTAPATMREDKNQRKWHLTLLAMNQDGLVNLNQLVSRSWAEGFYRWPTVHSHMLQEHRKGLIVLSGCADSLLACTLLGGKSVHVPGCQDPDHATRKEDRHNECDANPNWDGALKVVRWFKRVFGDRYYLEVQQFPELERSCTLNPIYAELSEETGVPLVASSDCHYPRPDDNELQKILHAAGRNTGTVAAAEAEWEYEIKLTLPDDDIVLGRRLSGTGLDAEQIEQAVASTGEIAERCNVVLPRSEQIRFPLPHKVKSAEELIWQKLRQGWKYRWDRNPHMRSHKREYVDRLKYEMSVIVPKDFCDYFLMISDCVIWAKENGIPVGPARGSAASSLTCWLLRITEVDPMQFQTMMFERFIDAGREDLPDIDLDFADDRRDEVRQHLVDIYGEDHVGNIGNFTRYRGKNAIDDVARVRMIPQWDAKVVKDLVIERSGGDSRFDASLEDTFDMFPNAKAMLDKWPELWDAVRLEGNYKGMGVHAAGIVVSNMPITDTCAIYQRDNVGKDNKTLQVIAYDKKDADYLGMLKADFLGLSTMGMISKCLHTVDMPLDELYQVPLDDPETIAAFTRGDVIGIFQFEGRATRLMTLDVAPKTFMEIADINALSRPGPLFSGASAAYVDVKNGGRKPEHMHPIVDKWTDFTHYQIIYQEQVLGILREMGNFPASFTGALRKIISLKLGEAQFNEFLPKFIQGAQETHGIEPELAEKVWSKMVTSATYSFNISHCISYGMLAFWTMWLKIHYPTAFYAAQLDKTAKDKWPPLIKDAERHGVSVRPPSVQHSGYTWEPHPEDHAVIAGFSQAPGFGDSKAIAIAEFLDGEDREQMDWHDLTAIKGIGGKTVEKIQAWAESEDPFELYYAQQVLGELRQFIKKHPWDIPIKPTVTSDEIPRDADNFHMTWMGIPKLREYKDFIEDERARSGKEPEDIMKSMEHPDLIKSCVLKCYDDGDEEVYLRFNRFKFPKFKEQLEAVKLDGSQVVIAKGVKRKGFGINVNMQNMMVIDVADVDDEEDSRDG
jgi:DNA polymerase-3 subunit alpha